MTEDIPQDVVEITPTGTAFATLRSDLLMAELGFSEELKPGIEIIQDGDHIALVAGTTCLETDAEINTSHGLSPEQAREIADALNEAADEAEAAAEDSAPEETESFVRRLLG